MLRDGSGQCDHQQEGTWQRQHCLSLESLCSKWANAALHLGHQRKCRAALAESAELGNQQCVCDVAKDAWTWTRKNLAKLTLLERDLEQSSHLSQNGWRRHRSFADGACATTLLEKTKENAKFQRLFSRENNQYNFEICYHPDDKDAPSTLMHRWDSRVAFVPDLHRGTKDPSPKKIIHTTSTTNVRDDRISSVTFCSKCQFSSSRTAATRSSCNRECLDTLAEIVIALLASTCASALTAVQLPKNLYLLLQSVNRFANRCNSHRHKCVHINWWHLQQNRGMACKNKDQPQDRRPRIKARIWYTMART